MEYRVSLGVCSKDGTRFPVGKIHPICWDNRDLISVSSGWTVLNQENLGSANDFVSVLEKGIFELTNNEKCYSIFETTYGIGTIQETLLFYQNLLCDCLDYPFSNLYGTIAI